MKIMAINGSPRKAWNTATLLQKALDEASAQRATTKLVQLYDLNFKGCKSCFECKRIGSKSYGRCSVQDDLTPLFREIREVDALLLGSPVYFGDITGEMKSFLERLIFPFYTYTDPPQSLFFKKIKTGFIFTLGIPEEMADGASFIASLKLKESFLSAVFGPTQSLFVYDTYQFDDYAKYVATRFDPSKKLSRRNEVFPLDCAKASELGKWLLSPIAVER